MWWGANPTTPKGRRKGRLKGMAYNFKEELMREGRDLKSRLSAYKNVPQTESTLEAIERIKCRLDMISTYLRVKYNILAY